MKIPSIILALLSPLTNAGAPGLYTAMFLPPGNITEFTAFLVVPPTSANLSISNNSQEIYSAIQPNNAVVAQMRIRNRQASPGVPKSWWFQPTWCCDLGTSNDIYAGPLQLYDELRAYSSIQLENSFILTPDGKLTFGWGDGSKADANPMSQAQTTFLPSGHNIVGLFNRAILGVNINNGGAWDFGNVEWKNIKIVVSTTIQDSSWCSNPLGASISLSKTQFLPQTGQVTCIVDDLVMTLPPVAAT